MSGFFDELKRRKVYRVAVAYAVASGGVIQLASAVFPAWELPNWALRLVVVLLLAGFPIALILAWAFDVTPSGIKATPQPVRHSRRNIWMLLAVAVVVSAAAGFFLLPRASADKLEKSIAVLPFDNFSDDKENAFFADGIQDDILTNLAKISDLKVISRTSVMSYRGRQQSVREIGRALGVSAILEGSVRKSGNRVRVNVQLINAATDRHIWAEDYDRDLTDVFAIQTDLARKIASALQARLSPTEKAQMTRKPTENGEAYLAFMEAHNLSIQFNEPPKLKQAEQLYERATQLDPTFALAHASLSQLQSWFYHTGDRTPARRNRARQFADRALELDPDLPEGHLARGFYYYYVELNYDAALQEFAVAKVRLPNESAVYLALGAIQRRQGKWAESTANLEKSAVLDPKNAWPLQNLAMNYQMQRNFPEAIATLDRALAIEAKSTSLLCLKAQWRISQTGDPTAGDEIVQQLKTLAGENQWPDQVAAATAYSLLVQRRWADILVLANSMDAHPPTSGAEAAEVAGPKALATGIARRNLGDEAAARADFEKAKAIAEQAVRADPSDASRTAQLAVVLAYLGEKERAVAEAQHAVALLPESADTFDGPVITEFLAEVYAIVGEQEKAIELLRGLLTRPSAINVGSLKLAPVWDPLRPNPKFRELIQQPSAKT